MSRSFKDVLQHVKELVDTNYNGNYERSILTAFNQLKTEDKRILLRGFIFTHISTPSPTEEPALEEVLDVPELKDEMEDLEAFNSKELIKLKTWLVKVVSIFILILLTIIILLSLFFSESQNFLFRIFGDLGQYLKLFFTL